MKKLTVDDFAVLKEPLETGRQSPSQLGTILPLSIFLQGLFFYITYNVAGSSSIFPNIELIKKYHLWITAVLVVLSIIYAIPAVYNRSQKIQYLLGILISQNVGAIFTCLFALFFIGNERSFTEESILKLTYVTLIIGILIFIVTISRFVILLKRGAYRKGTKRDEIRSDLERMIKSHLAPIIIGSLGLVYIIQFLFRFADFDGEEIPMICIALLIFYTMLFVLPEQLVILYCKIRFKSFNFNPRGYLFSEDENVERNIKHGN